jgi:hypothetical protein
VKPDQNNAVANPAEKQISEAKPTEPAGLVSPPDGSQKPVRQINKSNIIALILVILMFLGLLIWNIIENAQYSHLGI